MIYFIPNLDPIHPVGLILKITEMLNTGINLFGKLQEFCH